MEVLKKLFGKAKAVISSGPATVTINGKKFTGSNISIRGSKIIVDGVEMTEMPSGPALNIVIQEGTLLKLQTDRNVNCNAVMGDVHAGGDVACDNVGGNINAGGDVIADDVKGSIVAGGDVVA